MKKLILALAVFALCLPSWGAEHGHGEDGNKTEEHVHKEPAPETQGDVGVTEKLGETITLDIPFADSEGRTVTMRELIDKPTIIAPVYFNCPNVCNFLQSNLSSIIPQIKMEAGKSYQVISFSFDENDTPEIAADKKRNYMKAADGKIAPEGWIFLTGTRENIKAFLDSTGYRFKRVDSDFAHPVAVVAVSPTGKIIRYLYGTKILPFELTMAAVEAENEKPGLSVKKIVSFCFSYDPQGKKYVFDIMKVSGVVILLTLTAFAAFLVFGGKKKKK
ncbi:SCO family protein [Geovibrio thiophilus]|uniref:SCO family protein n=1 Tax=Geovibrio thiophilus TaxID=139438 RepID=A0A3R5UU78_9BACT|nr:SCO family protein [Geovibrio thiophilus]QAR32599.1 SCO family protein [Geovibrio thiophilus]